MGLFDWIGKGKREEEWMAQPRRLPSGVDETSDDDVWLMSHEFANDENKNIRVYMGARKRKGEKTWTISLFKTDLKRDTSGSAYPEYDTDYTEDPLAVVRALSDFDRRYRNSEDWVPIDGHRGSYRPYANKNGIHFDDDGNIIRVEADTRLEKGTFLNRESLDELFHHAANKTPEIDTWEEVYTQLVGKWPADWTVSEEKLVPAKVLEPEAPKTDDKPAEVKAPAESAPSSAEAPAPEAPKEEPKVEEAPKPVEPKFETIVVTRPLTLDDLSKHVTYPQFGYETKKLMEQLKQLPEDLRSKKTTRRQKEQLIQNIAQQYYLPVDEQNAPEVRLAQRLRDTTLLVGLLRAGSELYEDFAKGKFSPDTMTLMSTLGRAASAIAENRLGVDSKSATKIGDIIAKGKDPNGPALPLETLFTQFPPAAFEPPVSRPSAPPPRKPSRPDYW